MEDLTRSFMDSLVGERIGRWVIERVVRAGGMGVVTAARNPELDQEVAIKFMRPEYASNAIASARFLREARLAARVKSPHFVRIFEYGRLELRGVPYLVMEMLSGSDLADELHVLGPHPVELAVDYVVQAAVGLAEIHALGVVHRDLKPSNLFMAEAAGTRTIKVLDFGVSKERTEGGAALTSTGTSLGTPHYMSPEQVRDSKSTDVRTDVWALGVILYELLTGVLPFGTGSESEGEIYGMILHATPVPLRQRKEHLPPGLEAVIAKCMERDREKRYATVGELASALIPFAPAVSLPRVDAIHRALAAPRPPMTSEQDLDAVRVARSSGTGDGEKATVQYGGKGEAPPARPVSADTGLPMVLGMASRAPRRPVVLMALAALGIAVGATIVVVRPGAAPPRASLAPSASATSPPVRAPIPATPAPAISVAAATAEAPAPPGVGDALPPVLVASSRAAPSPLAAPRRTPPTSAHPVTPAPGASSDLLFDRK